ncbi:MAG: ROK family protein [Acidimicrobiales bacterium]
MKALSVTALASSGKSVAGANRYALALDIGGTKVAAGLVGVNGQLTTRVRAPTPRADSAEPLFQLVLSLALRVLAEAGDGCVDVCGIGCGGPMVDAGEFVSPLNIPAWRDFPLRSRLEEHLGMPCFLDNDAKALTLGEGWVGAARESRAFMAMVVSTGIGGGIVVDGRLLDGPDGNAGHIGHVIVEPHGRECVCGSFGCLEAEASGVAIGHITGKPAAEASLEVRRRTGLLVGRAVASAANLLELELIVVSGSVALGFGDAFFHSAQEEIDRHATIGRARGARIVSGALGASGPLVGAGAVGWRGKGVGRL